MGGGRAGAVREARTQNQDLTTAENNPSGRLGALFCAPCGEWVTQAQSRACGAVRTPCRPPRPPQTRGRAQPRASTLRRATSPPPRLPASWGAIYEQVGQAETAPVLALHGISAMVFITGNYEDLPISAISATEPATTSSLRATGHSRAWMEAAQIGACCAAASRSQRAPTDVLTSSISLCSRSFAEFLGGMYAFKTLYIHTVYDC